MRSRYRGGRWCGRGDAARRPPIPIKGHRPALMSTLPQVRCASNLPVPGRGREGPEFGAEKTVRAQTATVFHRRTGYQLSDFIR